MAMIAKWLSAMAMVARFEESVDTRSTEKQ